jgi:hypothetical protein
MALDFLSLEGLNEADVREELITPLLHKLGYRSGTSANIFREVSLRYPRVFIGRKNMSRDPYLRGRADYLLEVADRVRWTIEAKPPGLPITIDDIEQAYSYACHPEVRAVLFAVTNGSEIRVFQTSRSPQTPPIVTLSGPEILLADTRLANLLGPDALLRDYPDPEPGTQEPLGVGLRSVVRIVSGWAQFERSTPLIPLLDELGISFTSGAIERDENDHLVMYLEGRSPFRSANEFNARLGLSKFEMLSEDRVLSADAGRPSVFRSQLQVLLATGETLPNLFGEPLRLQNNVRITSTTTGRAVLSNRRLFGEFEQLYDYQDFPELGDGLTVEATGHCELLLG